MSELHIEKFKMYLTFSSLFAQGEDFGKDGGKTNITFNIPLKCLRKTIKHKQLLFVFSKLNKNEKIIF